MNLILKIATIKLLKTNIEGSNNRQMAADIHFSIAKEKSPIVIFCHGYKGFKDWGCWNLVADEFAKNGFNFIKFNLSHNGTTLDFPEDFVDLEAFGNNNHSKELFDLKQVVDWVYENKEFQDKFDLDKIYLIGHSRGGGNVLLQTARDSRVKKAITWAGVSNHLARLPVNTEEWSRQGVIFQMNGRTKQNMPVYYQLFENSMQFKEDIDIEKAAKKIEVPFLIIYGKEDFVVKEEEAFNLNNWIGSSRLLAIENTGHTFDSKYPWDKKKLPEPLEKVIIESVNFLK